MALRNALREAPWLLSDDQALLVSTIAAVRRTPLFVPILDPVSSLTGAAENLSRSNGMTADRFINGFTKSHPSY